MASGDLLAQLKCRDADPPASNFAPFVLRNNRPVAAFDTTTQETLIWEFWLPANYDGNGITVYVVCAAATATSGTIGWDVAFERIGTSQDIDADSFASAKTITAATVNGTAGIPQIGNVAFSNSEIDGLVASELAAIRIRRDVANDNATGDAHFKMAALINT